MTKFISKLKPINILYFTLLYLFLAFLLSFLIDILNVYGIRDLIVANLEMDLNPIIWYQLFQDGSPTEILQWLFLGFSAISSGILVGKFYHKDNKIAAFWLLLGITFTLMLIEDAGNPRHFYGQRLQRFINPGGNDIRTIVTLLFYSILAFIPIYAVIKYGKHLIDKIKNKKILIYFSLGFVFYGIAAFSSATRDIFNWYQRVGNFLYFNIINFGNEELLMLTNELDMALGRVEGRGIGWYFMDLVLEESIELLGATFFLIATLLLLKYTLANKIHY